MAQCRSPWASQGEALLHSCQWALHMILGPQVGSVAASPGPPAPSLANRASQDRLQQGGLAAGRQGF